MLASAAQRSLGLKLRPAATDRVHLATRGCFRMARLQGLLCGGELGRWSFRCRPVAYFGLAGLIAPMQSLGWLGSTGRPATQRANNTFGIADERESAATALLARPISIGHELPRTLRPREHQ